MDIKKLSSSFKPFGIAILVLILVNFLIVPRINIYFLQILILIGINSILAVSLNLILGHTGQFSIGHGGFMAIGAYSSAALSFYFGPDVNEFLSTALGLPQPASRLAIFLCSILSAGLLSSLAGLIVGIPTLRLRGDYLAIATLGFGEIIRVVILNLDFVGGARGFYDVPAYRSFFWVYFWVIATAAVVHNMVSSTKGKAFLAIREDEIAAESVGINTTRYKVIAFVTGAFFAGIAGALFAHYMAYLHTGTFTFLKSIEIIVMVILGGMGSITGSILAAIVLTSLPEALRPIKDYRMVMYSLLLIVLMLTRPKGLFGMKEITWRGIKSVFLRLKGGLS